MPELPEVETIRKGLEKYLLGETITAIDLRTPSIFSGDPNAVIGATVKAVRRRGKGLLIELANGYTIAVHVKMTGQFVYRETNRQKTDGTSEKRVPLWQNKEQRELPNKHTHVIFTLRTQTQDQRAMLYFNDIRKFGWIHIVKTKEVEKIPFFQSLGIDPLESLTKEQFAKIASSSNAPIKSLLMDQHKIAGVGNIYANEALFEARIDPRKSAKLLTQKEQAALLQALVHVLRLGLQHGGASDNNYINVDGGKGSFQQHFRVYRKHGSACPVCGTTIKRLVIAGRGTFFCPACQR